MAAAVETGITPESEAQAAEKISWYLNEPANTLGTALVPEPWVNARVPLRERVAEIIAGSRS